MPPTASRKCPDSTLLTSCRLNGEEFVTLRRVLLLDDRERGPVDEATLRRLARNTNDHAGRGNFTAIALGRARPKHTVIVVKDGKRYVRHGSDEASQPAIVGFATAFEVSPFQGRPCLYADLHLDAEDADLARSLPFREFERQEPEDIIDRIVLLRTAPGRDPGVVRYERDEARGRRRCYARRTLEPAITTHPRRETRAMTTAQMIRDVAEQVALDLFSDHYSYEHQKKDLENIRVQENLATLDDDKLSELACLPPDEFAIERNRVIKHYSRRPAAIQNGRMVNPVTDPAGETHRAISLATRLKISFPEALAKLRSASH